MSIIRSYLVLLLVLGFGLIQAQSGVIENRIYVDRFKTPTLHPIGYPFGTPLIQMGTRDQLILGFDEIGQTVADLQYAIIQCDYKWEPTGESSFDFIDGFSDGWVTDYDFSFNTTVNYIHYNLRIPNEDFSFTQSGNYVVVIYEDDMDDPILTRRFMVARPLLIIDGGVAVTRNPSYRDRFQEIVFDVAHEGFDIRNPYQEVNAVVTQNDRWDNAIMGVKPYRIGDQRLSFDHNMKIVFPTAREFREMDIRTLRYRTEGVRAVDVRDTVNYVYLMPDQMRRKEDYRPEGDLNGKFLVDRQEGRIGELEADYAYVQFNLPFDNELSNGTFYVVGAFNEYALTEENEMTFNSTYNSYETTVFMKQGFYNYMYVFVEHGSDLRDHSFTEGNYYDTENDYAVYVYYRPFGQRYDALIGFSFLNTKLTRF